MCGQGIGGHATRMGLTTAHTHALGEQVMETLMQNTSQIRSLSETAGCLQPEYEETTTNCVAHMNAISRECGVTVSAIPHDGFDLMAGDSATGLEEKFDGDTHSVGGAGGGRGATMGVGGTEDGNDENTPQESPLNEPAFLALPSSVR